MAKAATDMVKQDLSGGLARPDWLTKGDVRGTEHITNEDLILPRLALAQGLSPELIRTDGKYIEGLKMGDIFNTLTGEILGEGPIDFTIIRADRPRGIEYIPKKDGGGVKDFNVPLDDPRMKFGPNREKPVATKFYDFIIMMVPSLEPCALSLKSTGLKVAMTINALMKIRQAGGPAPSFAGKYQLRSVLMNNAKGTFAQFQVKNNGWLDKETFLHAEHLYEIMKNKSLAVETDPADMEDPDADGDSKEEM